MCEVLSTGKVRWITWVRVAPSNALLLAAVLNVGAHVAEHMFVKWVSRGLMQGGL